MRDMKIYRVFTLVFLLTLVVPAQPKKPRARDLGIPFTGATGTLNAITDVSGVEVGYSTLNSGDGRNAVRTGVTAILPRGKEFRGRVFAAWHTLNGNGEMTGTTWIEEAGGLGTPVMITNTHSVGVVRDAVIEWNTRRSEDGSYSGRFSKRHQRISR
jgi:D-aminopeptidase